MKGFQIFLWFNYSATARGKRSSTQTKTKSRTPLFLIYQQVKSYYCNKNKSFAFASSSQRLICQQPSSKQDIYNPRNQHIHHYQSSILDYLGDSHSFHYICHNCHNWQQYKKTLLALFLGDIHQLMT